MHDFLVNVEVCEESEWGTGFHIIWRETELGNRCESM